MDELERVIARETADSLFVLSDFTGATLDKLAADRMKVVATKDSPHVHRSALVGAESIPDVYYHDLESFSARHFSRFKSRAEALEWLTADDVEATAS